MKKRSISLSLVLLVITVMNTRAQGFHLGIKAGANLLKVDGESFSQGFQFGYNVGAFAELNWSSKWGIQPEVMFNQTNYRTGSSFNSIYPDGINDVKGKLNYLSIPVLLSFKPIPLLSFQAGPQFGILMSQNDNLVQNGENAFKKGDLAILAGAQLNLFKLIVGARYVIGLTNINDLSNQENWKNTGFQVYAGFRII
jgi:outer membrane protein with beta-barrel domain